jgi:hypothetical protein
MYLCVLSTNNEQCSEVSDKGPEDTTLTHFMAILHNSHILHGNPTLLTHFTAILHYSHTLYGNPTLLSHSLWQSYSTLT